MQIKAKRLIALIIVLVVCLQVQAKPLNEGLDYGVGHLVGRRSLILQGGMNFYEKLGVRGVISFSKAHNKVFESRPFISGGYFLEEYLNIALGYNMGFMLVENGRNVGLRLVTGVGGRIGFPAPKIRYVNSGGRLERKEEGQDIEFNIVASGEVELEIGLGRRLDLLIGGGARYMFFESQSGKLGIQGTVGIKINF